LSREAVSQPRSKGWSADYVLWADPDTSLPPVYREPLSRAGFDLVTAFSGLECVARLRERVPDVLVLEPNMHWGGGDGVLAIMRESPDLAKVPVMILTSCRDPHVVKGLEPFSINDHHFKPLSPDRLPEKLRRCVDHPRLRFTLGDKNGRLRCAIVRQTGSRVRDLCVEVRDGRVIVGGCAQSHHVKQLVLAAVVGAMEASESQGLRVESEIEVCGDCQSTVPGMCFKVKKKSESRK
jgi:CheY-like chemotaxis protein